MPPVLLDMYKLDEDKRIDLIGKTVMCKNCEDENMQTGVPVMVDYENGTKADRYIKKLQERFPGIRVIKRERGPVAETETFFLAPPVN